MSSQDRAVSVELQRELGRHINAHTVELVASHMSLLSLPRAVANIIRDAVNNVAEG